MLQKIEVPEKKPKKFVSLTPILHPDEESIYLEALNECIGDNEVSNIALTGPFGSGKSSVLKRYLHSKPANIKHLVISLASFESRESKVETKELELGVLQQILYSSSSDGLPESRFSRIRKPETPTKYTALIILWAISLVTVIISWRNVLTLPIDSWLLYMSLLPILILLITSFIGVNKVLSVYKSSPVRKISFKNIQFEASRPETSILNKYLDEIIYFFDVKDYNLVIFEDIDRLNDKDIFIKLREINSLLNNNETIRSKKHIQFLYAIKDSTFSEKERTKFFEFIIPVVPAVGSYNSDIIIHQRAELLQLKNKSFNHNFIQNISEYLNDPRLIHNIFNELSIYLGSINDENLDPNVMLAIMIYKNLYGKDFEELHDSKGDFRKLLDKKNSLIKLSSENLEKNISDLKLEIKNINNEKSQSDKELFNIYLCELFKSGINTVFNKEGEQKSLFNLNSAEELVDLMEVATGVGRKFNGHNIHFDWESIQNEIDPESTLEERLDNLVKRAENKNDHLEGDLRNLKTKVDQLKDLKLSELLKMHPDILNNFFINTQIDDENNLIDHNHRLMRYLILNDYLNEDYQIYTSIFREQQHWTRNDRLFLTTLRSAEEPIVDSLIDNPSEMIRRLVPSDFSSKYILNIFLIDYIINKPNLKNLLKRVFDYIKESYSESTTTEFFQLYLRKGREKKKFYRLMLENWPDYVMEIYNKNYLTLEMEDLLKNLEILSGDPEHVLEKINYSLEHFSSQAFKACKNKEESKNILNSMISLDSKVNNLRNFDNDSDSILWILKNNLYVINNENLLVIINLESNIKANSVSYTLVMRSNITSLIEYVNGDGFKHFVEGCLLSNDYRGEDSLDKLTELLNKEGLSHETCHAILSRQDNFKVTLQDIPERLWSAALEALKVEINWRSVQSIYESKQVNSSLLAKIFNNKDVVNSLTSEEAKASNRDINRRDIDTFIRESEALSSENYLRLCRKIGRVCSDFPSIEDEEKLFGLAKNKLVRLTSKSLSSVDEYPRVQAILILKNSGIYRDNDWSLQPEAIIQILNSPLLRKRLRQKIVGEITTSDIEESTRLSDALAKNYLKLDSSLYDTDVLVSLLTTVSDSHTSYELFQELPSNLTTYEKISILADVMDKWTESNVMKALSSIVNPKISRIAKYGSAPTIPRHTATLKLVQALWKNRYISSYRELNDGIKIYTKRS